jgi:hypothetical protein
VIDTFAPGWPGIPARWTSSAESGLAPAVSRDFGTSSRLDRLRRGLPVDEARRQAAQIVHAFAEHGELKGTMAQDGGDADAVLARFVRVGIDVDAIAIPLQRDGAHAFVTSWQALMRRIDDKSAVLARPVSVTDEGEPLTRPALARRSLHVVHPKGG